MTLLFWPWYNLNIKRSLKKNIAWSNSKTFTLHSNNISQCVCNCFLTFFLLTYFSFFIKTKQLVVEFEIKLLEICSSVKRISVCTLNKIVKHVCTHACAHTHSHKHISKHTYTFRHRHRHRYTHTTSDKHNKNFHFLIFTFVFAKGMIQSRGYFMLF